MLKKRVLKRLLPLLFSFCCVFSGFLSVNAFAADVSPDAKNDWFLLPLSNVDIFYSNVSDPTSFIGTFDDVRGTYSSTTTSNGNLEWVFLNAGPHSFTGPFFENGHTYYFYYSFSFWSLNGSSVPPIGRIGYRPTYADTFSYDFDERISEFNAFNNNTLTYSGIVSKSFTSDSALQTPSAMFFQFFGLPSDAGRFDWVVYCIDVTDKSDEQLSSLITAINNQTGVLQGSIGQAADDVQQSIEDQYSGDPEEEFSVEDVIAQHNEKMGVLSFGSDVMLQFLDMFQSANVGTAELTLPGFNITVENVEYSVWPDYSFNFEQLNEWVPALMSVIRVMLPAFVWLMVLRYCIKVFEDNFLAK